MSISPCLTAVSLPAAAMPSCRVFLSPRFNPCYACRSMRFLTRLSPLGSNRIESNRNTVQRDHNGHPPGHDEGDAAAQHRLPGEQGVLRDLRQGPRHLRAYEPGTVFSPLTAFFFFFPRTEIVKCTAGGTRSWIPYDKWLLGECWLRDWLSRSLDDNLRDLRSERTRCRALSRHCSAAKY